jgi:hypothetical protein
MLEGRKFTIFTDHKPLTYALGRTSDPWSARQARQLSYLAERTADIKHIAGERNIVADTLSLQFQAVEVMGASLVCDFSTGVPRPLIPVVDRRQVFEAFHGLAHAGTRATRRQGGLERDEFRCDSVDQRLSTLQPRQGHIPASCSGPAHRATCQAVQPCTAGPSGPSTCHRRWVNIPADDGGQIY